MTEGSSVINTCLVGTRVFEGHWSLCLENRSFLLVSMHSESFSPVSLSICPFKIILACFQLIFFFFLQLLGQKARERRGRMKNIEVVVAAKPVANFVVSLCDLFTVILDFQGSVLAGL